MQEALGSGERRAILEALDDEHRAWAIYDQVIQDHGPVRPFINIRDAEARHIEALASLLRRYGHEVPTNPWIGRAPRYASVHEACAAGVDAEIANADLYDRLLAAARHEDVRRVFGNLQEASQERHLEAFRRCVARQDG
jgi:hypothetical protein